MKRITWICLLIAMALTGCAAQDRYSGTLITAGQHRIETGQTEETVTVMLGGQLAIENGGRLIGSILLLGGDLTVDGTVVGDVSAAGGQVRLGPNSVVDGSLVSAGANVSRADGAVVGDYITADEPSASVSQQTPWGQRGLTLVLQMLSKAAIAYVLLKLQPRPLQRAGEALRRYPHIAAAVGALAAIVILVLLVQMAFTVVLIPVSIGLGVLFVATLWLTSVLYGAALAPLARNLVRRRSLSLAASGALAAAGFSLLFEVLAQLPWVGAPLQLLIVASGLGALILTRFGLRPYEAIPDHDLL